MDKKELKKLALKRQQESESIVNEIGLSLSDKLFSVSVLVPHIGFSQSSLGLLSHVNSFLKQYRGVDINIYTQNKLIHMVQPLCGVFEYNKISYTREPIICTNLSTCMDAIDSLSNQIYFYVTNIDFIRPSAFLQQQMDKISSDKRVKIFLRDKSHKKYIEEYFDNDIIECEIPDFQIELMIRIIIEESK